ncbi:hypothetical protein [Pseudoponticoccus marisrubri]|uniref:Uncharacterized protein n=1 Tax=Pseudoponticoccus marisrubri TaxID=1685382 RepID=A0A0W7WKX8_9RHOB|nr:hypothetical protein [Pseudoponticoccus marisrubri]KUF11243.1 hypothetical protein AVJ23_09350 [Pseudoponticoccus marisrubri]
MGPVERQAEEAARIAQDMLDRTGAALIARDFDSFAAFFRLPKTLATEDGIRLLRNTADLRAAFDNACDHYAESGVTRLDRQVEAALFDGPEIIRFAHVTLLHGAEGPIRAPYTSCSVIARLDEGWRVVDSQYALREASAHSAAVLKAGVTGEPGEPDEGADRMDAVQTVFQSALDRMTEALLAQDYAAFRAGIALPFFMQGSESTSVLVEEDELEREFARSMTEFEVLGVTDLVRQVKGADMVGTRRIYGRYRTHILSGTRLVLPGYVSTMSLEQGADLEWRATTLMHPLGRLTLARIMREKLGDGA